MKRINTTTIPKQSFSPMQQIKICYVGSNFTELVFSDPFSDYEINNSLSLQLLYSELTNKSSFELPDVLLLEVETDECFSFIQNIKKLPILQNVLIFLLSKVNNEEWKAKAKALKVQDLYTYPFNSNHLHDRMNYLHQIKSIAFPEAHEEWTGEPRDLCYKMPLTKRLFDIIVSGILLIMLSPLFIIIAIMIRSESEGAVIYRSKRVGTNYHIFDFYKFRSMRTGADAELVTLAAQNNQYKKGKESAFVKIVNDPRVTKTGEFIRKTSIDELPQLFNILVGDMSFVGNRPLPLYEAEMLTTNQWSERFFGPAGLTGLWQISKRGKTDISERERKQLDNDYVSQHSFMLDAKIILRTFPALIQSAKV
ncbi:MAG TPA: sugar transferase [Ferruginibacter sp.]|nr:sugar transferase [Ferruginibacter sp.]